MKIIWDEPKRQANLAKHGFDFADLDPDFFYDAVVVTARDGRFAAIGPFSGTMIFTVYIELGTEAVSVISTRHADRRERTTYAQAI